MPTAAAAPPERSIVQRMEALQSANKIRSKRAKLKMDLKAGRVSLIDILIEPPEWLHSARVFDLLLAVPKYGRVKTNKVLQLCRISPSKTIAGLTPRQRTELASTLPGRLTPGRVAAPIILPVRDRRSINAAPPPVDQKPTRFQRAVLLHAAELGTLGPAYIDEIAERTGSTTSAVGLARSQLRRLQMIDEFGYPTDRGRAYLIEPAA